MEHLNYIYITLVTNQNEQFDLKVPDFIKISELIKMLSEALEIRVSDSVKLQAEPLGIVLDNEDTLADSNVCDGALITII